MFKELNIKISVSVNFPPPAQTRVNLLFSFNIFDITFIKILKFLYLLNKQLKKRQRKLVANQHIKHVNKLYLETNDGN